MDALTPAEHIYDPKFGAIPHCRMISQGADRVDARWHSLLYNSFWRVYFNQDAGAALVFPDHVVELPARIPVLVPAWSLCRTAAPRVVRHAYIHFEPVGIPADTVRRSFRSAIVLPAVPEWIGLLEQIPLLRPLEHAVGFRCQSMLAQMMAEACSGMALHGDAGDGTSQKRVSAAVAWIDGNPFIPTTLAQLATRCSLKRDRFSSLFRAATGVTPMRYLVERRVTAAAGLLLDDDDTIDRIATRTGFADRYHFTRAFYRVFHITPGRYRRR
jgi:AraC-like DNA-binding protein